MALPVKEVTEEKNPYAVNKALFEEASAIKEKMKLIEGRLEKMESHRQDVSEAVYFKVKTDYSAQLDEVKAAFEDKSVLINQELAQLYQSQKEQEVQLEANMEVLEEAKFRNVLGEFTDKKFKELETKQNKEIGKYQELLNFIKGSIQQYEDILGHPYQPGSRVERPLRETPKGTPTTPKSTPKGQKALEEDTSRTGKASYAKGSTVAEKGTDELDMFLEGEGDYFSERQEAEGLISESELGGEEAVPSSPSLSSPPSVSTSQPVDDSISSILRDIPMEEEPSEVVPKPPDSSTSAKIDITEFPMEASLLLIEGELDEPEFILGENTSIGRSPSNDVVLKESKVSRHHATINYTNGNYVLVDLKSSNGVFVNGKRSEEATLKDGDEIAIGSFKFQFNLS